MSKPTNWGGNVTAPVSVSMGDFYEGATPSAAEVLAEFMSRVQEHPDMKVLAFQDGGSPPRGDAFPVTAACDQNVMVIKILYR